MIGITPTWTASKMGTNLLHILLLMLVAAPAIIIDRVFSTLTIMEDAGLSAPYDLGSEGSLKVMVLPRNVGSSQDGTMKKSLSG